jgi:hypothetical protein
MKIGFYINDWNQLEILFDMGKRLPAPEFIFETYFGDPAGITLHHKETDERKSYILNPVPNEVGDGKYTQFNTVINLSSLLDGDYEIEGLVTYSETQKRIITAYYTSVSGAEIQILGFRLLEGAEPEIILYYSVMMEVKLTASRRVDLFLPFPQSSSIDIQADTNMRLTLVESS